MSPEQILIAHLKTVQCLVATVESCTGGLIAHRITQAPGASDVFWGGLITYDNSAKELLTGVPHEALIEHGAVSAEVARLLAEGGLAVMQRALASAGPQPGRVSAKLHACVATTGIAGPGGGSPDKPVGLCYVGLAIAELGTWVGEIRAPSDRSREQCKELFAQTALDLLVRQLPSGSP
jgi:PncC family amidohydrolase